MLLEAVLQMILRASMVLECSTQRGTDTSQIHCAQGTERFYAKHYEACIQLFTASMQYCSDDAQRAKGARLLALCSLACNDPTRCWEDGQTRAWSVASCASLVV